MSTSRAIGPMAADLLGSERVRRHPHRRARSAPQCGVAGRDQAVAIKKLIDARDALVKMLELIVDLTT